MKKIILISFVSCLMFASELDILNDNKKELRQLEKVIIEKSYDTSKNDWISPLNLSSSLSRSHSFSDENDKFTKSISLGFSQSIYKSGGIEFTIKYAKAKLKSDSLSWENTNNEMLESIYEILLNISKLNNQIKQNKYKLLNKDIELILKKLQYEAGTTDIIELNNAIMSKNSQYKENIGLKNSLSEQELELSKYTDLHYQEIEIMNFDSINKNDFIKNNIELLYENSLIEVLHATHEKLKSSYLPNISISSKLSHSQNEDLITNIKSESTSASLSLNMSMPLYDINKKATLEKSRLEVLKQQHSISDLKNDITKDFDEAINKINMYKDYRKIIEENLNLYNDLISVNKYSNTVGMSTTYDLEVLENTKKINQFDLAINGINTQIEYTKLYFKLKGNK